MAEKSKGLLDSLAAFASTLVDVVYTRLELLSTDLEEDRERLFSLVALYLAAMFFFAVGLVLAAIFLVVAFWETHRLVALGLLAGLFLLAGALAGGFAIHMTKTKPKLFSASLLELLKDKEKLDSD
ncbi:MAG TPA: phage holin family protein [Methylotenera sp.]|nr:phage holin family protein [Methylotenera sp.]HPV44722.1 phage holin family protein [Methylotenera sp.]